MRVRGEEGSVGRREQWRILTLPQHKHSNSPDLPICAHVCAGPPADVDTVLAMFDHVRQQWPGASVHASTLESYLDGLTQALEAGGVTLPVVTGESH
jgi:hypothetical protein